MPRTTTWALKDDLCVEQAEGDPDDVIVLTEREYLQVLVIQSVLQGGGSRGGKARPDQPVILSRVGKNMPTCQEKPSHNCFYPKCDLKPEPYLKTDKKVNSYTKLLEHFSVK